ncbi:efflux RND transporter periplasmic adaptor subunit [Luteolibacter marinus]|uniref:efflux RND transporter periplasmic adaptor subunit n=1 Tax=Luteolibacter marinus TaxID=2776705 RepID=UPI0018682A3B|nr:efflux RND transporter periplasmic adaptor subunit [Luteolibacter marinus]
MRFPVLLLLVAAILPAAAAEDTNTIVLDETGVKNLRIETVEVEEADFEETFFSLGHIEAIPEKIAGVSSRIAGRIVELQAHPGDTVEAGQVVAKIESRQPGDPPPVIPLEAPIGGLVTKAMVRLGEPMNPDQTLLEITDLGEVYAVAKVPEHFAGRVKAGTQAHIRVVALPEETFDGELVRFGTSADEESGTIDAIFLLPNENGRIRAGMRAEFSVVLSKRPGVLSIPRSALQGEASNRFVYVRHFDLPNAFIKTPVQVGQMNDRFAEVVGGLFPADEVVTRGGYSLSFAGTSSVSLKEALDAAHGHEHAEDGSELTPEKAAEMEAKKRAEAGLPPAGAPPGNPLWKYATGVLFVLLVISLVTRKQGAAGEESPHSNNPPEDR